MRKYIIKNKDGSLALNTLYDTYSDAHGDLQGEPQEFIDFGEGAYICGVKVEEIECEQ